MTVANGTRLVRVVRADERGWFAWARHRFAREIADIELGYISTTSCILANNSLKLEHTLTCDSVKQEMLNDDEANKLLRAPTENPGSTPNRTRCKPFLVATINALCAVIVGLCPTIQESKIRYKGRFSQQTKSHDSRRNRGNRGQTSTGSAPLTEYSSSPPTSIWANGCSASQSITSFWPRSPNQEGV